MSKVTIDPTGTLVVAGKRVFPIVLSQGPPATGTTPSGKNALAEVAAGGVSFLRTGGGKWSKALLDGQLSEEQALQQAAAAHGLLCWCWLGALTNLPAQAGSPTEALLTEVVNGLKGNPGLGAWKGADEPALAKIPAAGLVRGYTKIRSLDPDHPLVIIQAPRGTVAELQKYATALDVTGADIYPVGYPLGMHAATSNKDVSVVGDITRTMVDAAQGRPVWMTLQIAWSGVLPPAHVPRFPTLLEERFMAYQAIVAGARGLGFFGGHLTEVTSPADTSAGWNWTFWQTVLRPVISELTSPAVAPALVAQDTGLTVTSSTAEVKAIAREANGFVYVIAIRRGPGTSQVKLSGLPTSATTGVVLAEYADGDLRPVEVSGKSVTDWFGPHDVHVYRFRA